MVALATVCKSDRISEAMWASMLAGAQRLQVRLIVLVRGGKPSPGLHVSCCDGSMPSTAPALNSCRSCGVKYWKEVPGKQMQQALL